MSLKDDDTICFCFHVSKRKIENFCRNQRPRYPSQIAECLSAGTGCGWCVPLLKKMHQGICGQNEAWWRQGTTPPDETTSASEFDSADDYAKARSAYLNRKKQRTPTDATDQTA